MKTEILFYLLTVLNFLYFQGFAVCSASKYVSFSLVFSLIGKLQRKVFVIQFSLLNSFLQPYPRVLRAVTEDGLPAACLYDPADDARPRIFGGRLSAFPAVQLALTQNFSARRNSNGKNPDGQGFEIGAVKIFEV